MDGTGSQLAPWQERSDLFGWQDGIVVLIGEHRDERWTVARAYRRADAMTDVRRWTFAAPSAFAGQVRRLVLEATGDSARSREAWEDARCWAERFASQPLS